MASPRETYIKRGDTPTKQWMASDDLPSAADTYIVIGRKQGTPIINRTVDTVLGKVATITFTAEETENVGLWSLELETRVGSVIQTFPERGFLSLVIGEDLNP